MLLQQDQRQTVTQRIDPKIILANSILQLTSAELAQAVEAELLANPAIEAIEDGYCAGDCVDPATCPYCSAARKAGEPFSESHDTGDTEVELDYSPGPRGPEPDEDFDVVSSLEAEYTLQDHLRALLHAALPAGDHAIGEYLLSSLDERGWLEGATGDIARDLDVCDEDVVRVLHVLQEVDLPGIGARDLRECLLLQLTSLLEDEAESHSKPIVRLALEFVRDSFDHVSARRYPKLARSAGVSQDEAKRAVDYIGTRLNPFPASQFRTPWSYRPTNSKSSVRPDVVIRRTESGYEIDVLGADASAFGIHPAYREMYDQIKRGVGRHSENDRRHYTEYVERAELFLRNLNQRRKTLRSITQRIAMVQTGFLETGSRRFLRPLTRTKIARMLSVHESTVSRATANKFVQLPNQEVVRYEVFFNASLSIKDMILEMIRSEDPSSPLSDQQIAHLLADRGYDVARRTVVKYREAEKILSSTHRRR